MKINGGTPITYSGETKTVSQWAKGLNLRRKTLIARFQRRVRDGTLSDEAISSALNKSKEDKSTGVRTLAILSLLEAFHRHSKDKVDAEVRSYIEEKGVLSFYREFGTFFPKNPNIVLDGANKEITNKPANMVIFASLPQQQTRTIVEVMEANDL